MEVGEPGAGGHIAANIIGDDDVVVVVVDDILTVFLVALEHQKWFNLNNKVVITSSVSNKIIC